MENLSSGTTTSRLGHGNKYFYIFCKADREQADHALPVYNFDKEGTKDPNGVSGAWGAVPC
jgi:hypothetical protein